MHLACSCWNSPRWHGWRQTNDDILLNDWMPHTHTEIMSPWWQDATDDVRRIVVNSWECLSGVHLRCQPLGLTQWHRTGRPGNIARSIKIQLFNAQWFGGGTEHLVWFVTLVVGVGYKWVICQITLNHVTLLIPFQENDPHTQKPHPYTTTLKLRTRRMMRFVMPGP